MIAREFYRSNPRQRMASESGAPAFTFLNLSAANAGGCSVIVTTPYGSVTSAVATLAVVTRPVIAAITANADGTITLNCAGTPNFSRRVQLCPRYSLRRFRTATDELELEVVDHYQADVSRMMRSLSGGESFQASLALALGLSELASGRHAIESLFIDEGMGSLDAESLETAMAALENLQARGRVIGLISHVDAIKERISTQIRVRKRDGGCSGLVVVSS